MKKYARILSVFALVLAITFIFSGCGVIDFAKSILIKNEETTIPSTTIAGDVVYNTPISTESAIVAPPAETTPSSQVGSVGTVITNPSTSTQTPTVEEGTTPAATSEKAEETTSKKNKKPNKTTVSTTKKSNKTTVPATKEDITVEDIEKMPIQQVQDLLFATEDPNTAGKILTACGFEYDSEQGIYYSSIDPWQKNFGFNVIYDMSAPLAGMYYSTERIQFDYEGKDWMIQLWKGQYGITSGAEIGVYNKTDKIMQYDCVSEDEFLEMSFDFYNQGEYVFTRGPEKHWWLTGFKIFNAGVPMLINLDITITFPKKSMADAFEKGLKDVAKGNLLDPITYTRGAKTFHIHW